MNSLGFPCLATCPVITMYSVSSREGKSAVDIGRGQIDELPSNCLRDGTFQASDYSDIGDSAGARLCLFCSDSS